LKGIGNLWVKRVDNIPLGQNPEETPVRVEHDNGADVLALHQRDRGTNRRSRSDADEIQALTRENLANTHGILLETIPRSVR
jgi:hypothetical protein